MSTARFMGLWALTAAPLHFAWCLIYTGLYSALVANHASGLFMVIYVLAAAVALILGFLQSALLTKHRVRVRFWPLAWLIGSLAAAFLAVPVSMQVWAFCTRGGYANLWIVHGVQMLVWGTTRGLCLGAALGLAVWGRRWTPAWTFWLAGLVVVETVACVVFQALGTDPARMMFLSAGAWALNGAIEAAGLAWLLDRLVFKSVTSERES